MRIVHAIFSRGLFGSERYAADLAARQAALGHDVHLIVHPRGRIAEIVASGVTVHRVGVLFRRFRVAGLLKRLAPDIVHAHLSAAARTLGAIRDRAPAVATLHVGYKPQQHDALQGLIALTDSAADDARGFGGPVVRIWNWAPETPQSTPLSAPDGRAAVRRELGIADDVFAVGFIGRLHPSKNPELLVRAYRAADLPNAALLMAGTGPEQEAVAKAAAGDASIRLLGYRNDARRLYQGFDLFVLPSRFEQVPLVLMEAMAAGVPILATSIESIAGFLPPPAELFPSEDEAALVTLLRSQAASGQRRVTYDLAAFDAATQVGKVMSFYDKVRA